MTDFKGFRDANKLTQVTIAEYLGCGQAFISQIESGFRPLPQEHFDKILANKDWDSSALYVPASKKSVQNTAITGDNYGIGNIGRISGGRNIYDINRGHSTGGAPTEPDTYSTNRKGVGVPYFDVDFTLGFDLIENDQTINPEYHIDFLQYNKADCWVNVTGKSMAPLIDHGDKIALKRVFDWTDNILYGEVYAVVTDDYRTIKKIRRSLKGDDYLRFVPENTAEFDEQDVHKQTIRGVYHVLGCAKLLS
jgi:transcriptional regulator with XRE-family HTH domain